jgi:hypothetical protein
MAISTSASKWFEPVVAKQFKVENGYEKYQSGFKKGHFVHKLIQTFFSGYLSVVVVFL